VSAALHPALSPPALVTPARPDAAAAPLAPSGPTDAAGAVASEVLFRGAGELLIDHHGTLYRLKKTSLGKLILTK